MHSHDATDLSPEALAQRFHLLAADATEYALFMVDPGGRLVCWNAGAERLFGYRTDEVIGHHFSRFYSPEDVISGQPEHELTTARESGHADSVRWQVRKDGSRFWCKANVTALYNEAKQVHAFARVMHDLTDTQEREAVAKRADGLAAANRGKEEFMAMLSHELRNPLSPILNALGILRQVRTDDPVIQQAGGIIERQVRQMVRLVDDLLDISRVTKGKLRLETEHVELRAVMNRAADAARPLLDARRHEFSLLLPTEPLWVEGDPGRLEQVAVNLLTNAAKYTDAGGLVRMTVAREGDDAVVRVADNGVGIPPEMLPRIFDLFTQVDGSLSRSHGGLGVGLALVRALVEMHGGRVTAASGGVGQGSEFAVKLPAGVGGAGHAMTTTLEPGTGGGVAPAGVAGRGQHRRRGQPEHAPAAVRARRPGGPVRADRPGGGGGLPPVPGAPGHRAAGDGRVRGGPADAGGPGAGRDDVVGAVRVHPERGRPGVGPAGGVRPPPDQAGKPGHPARPDEGPPLTAGRVGPSRLTTSLPPLAGGI
jgi:PAS domain S-box-containing protein